MRRTFFVRPNMNILVHGALSRLAIIMCKLAKHYNCKIFGTVERGEQIEEASKMGYEKVLTYQDFDQQIPDNTFSVTYDCIGGDLLSRSIKSMKSFGLLVGFGQVLDVFRMPQRQDLSRKSLFITFTELQDYKKNHQELHLSALEVFALIYGGILPSKATKCYSFEEIPLAVKSVQDRQKLGPIAVLL